MAPGSKTADQRLRALADGNSIPVLGLGVWQIPALSGEVMAELDALDETGGTDRALESDWW
jgi:diketogulonate reductase-like aldo/keto reductase